MEFEKTVRLRDGRLCLLRSGTERDGRAALENYLATHEQTDYLLSYPDESTMDAEQEGRFLQKLADSDNEVEILAEVNGEIVATAGISAVGTKEKVRHRANFGVSVDRRYWGLGIGTALLDACVDCARRAGYEQLELSVVADNARAIELYRKAGFTECGRNPRGFRSRRTGYQELVSMRLELN